jgi:2,4-dienoyl-CoA reductase-like NADH-dependent reductase (Old Yellow Enzyme family)
MGKFDHVLSPFKIGNVQLKNRIELAPACYMLASHDGYVTREMVAYYQHLARGGAGIITIGESPIDVEYASGHEFSTEFKRPQGDQRAERPGRKRPSLRREAVESR